MRSGVWMPDFFGLHGLRMAFMLTVICIPLRDTFAAAVGGTGSDAPWASALALLVISCLCIQNATVALHFFLRRKGFLVWGRPAQSRLRHRHRMDDRKAEHKRRFGEKLGSSSDSDDSEGELERRKRARQRLARRSFRKKPMAYRMCVLCIRGCTDCVTCAWVRHWWARQIKKWKRWQRQRDKRKRKARQEATKKRKKKGKKQKKDDSDDDDEVQVHVVTVSPADEGSPSSKKGRFNCGCCRRRRAPAHVSNSNSSPSPRGDGGRGRWCCCCRRSATQVSPSIREGGKRGDAATTPTGSEALPDMDAGAESKGSHSAAMSPDQATPPPSDDGESTSNGASTQSQASMRSKRGSSRSKRNVEV